MAIEGYGPVPDRGLSVVRKDDDDLRYTAEMTDEKTRFVSSFYRKHWLQLRNSLNHLLHDSDLADDIAQDSFLRVNTLDQPHKLQFPYAYLYRTAINLIRDREKARQIRNRYRDLMADNPTEHIDSISPEHKAIARERLEKLSRAIDKLPGKCRQVFLMHKVQNLDHKTIAEQLGISRHAVEKHIMRALARCQSAFERDVEE